MMKYDRLKITGTFVSGAMDQPKSKYGSRQLSRAKGLQISGQGGHLNAPNSPQNFTQDRSKRPVFDQSFR